MPFSEVKIQRRYLKVAEQLMEYIKTNNIETGQRLPSERDLSQDFGVSRPTIREAIIALEIAGIVEIRSGSGIYLLKHNDRFAPLTNDQGPGPFEILEARKMIESEACAQAAERITDDQLLQLSKQLQAMEQENKLDSSTEHADEKFHCTIAEATGNSAISATISWLWQLRNQSEISTHFLDRVRAEGIKPIIAHHRAILNALQARDPDAARTAMSNHLQWVIDDLLRAVSGQDSPL